MNRSLWFKSGLVAATAAWSVAAMAQSSSSTVSSSATPSAAGTSTAEAESVAPKGIQLPVGLGATSFFYGPRVNTPTDNKISGDENNRDSFGAIFLRQRFNLKYKPMANTVIAPRMEFDYQLSDPSPEKKALRQFRWRDASLLVQQNAIVAQNIKGNDIGLDAYFRWYVPTSKSSRDNHTIGKARFGLMPSIAFGKSGFSLTSDNYYIYHAQTRKYDPKGGALARSSLYTGPQLNYQINDNINAFVLYEASVDYNTEGNNTNDLSPLASQSDFEPGMDIKLHDRVTLSPYLNWWTNQPLYTTTLNLAAEFKLL